MANTFSEFLYKILDRYSRHLPFPQRGQKFFLPLLKFSGIQNRQYNKKISRSLIIKVNPEEHIQRQLFWYGSYEIETWELMSGLLQPTDIALDLGANIGYFSLLSADFCREGKVISFEPDLSLYQELVENIRVNQLTNILPVQAAAGSDNKTGTLFLASKANRGMNSLAIPETHEGITQACQIVRIDDWLFENRIESVQLIKMDIEGGEPEALAGMKDLLYRSHPFIITEVNPTAVNYFGKNINDIFDIPASAGYSFYLLTKQGKLKSLDPKHLHETQVVTVLMAHPDRPVPSECLT